MISDSQRFVRLPATLCWIKHIVDGKYSPEEKVLYTIFGKVKRVKIYATVVEKKEILGQKSEDSSFSDENSIKTRLQFDLDDGTGILRSILWNEDSEKFSNIQKGALVNVMGIVSQWNEYINLRIEWIKLLEDSNFILLRDAEIIKKYKLNEIVEIPNIFEDELSTDDLSEEIEIDSLLKIDDDKEMVFKKIEKLGGEIKGISFDILKKELKMDDETLKKHLSKLEMDSRIYQNKENHYQLI